MATGSDSLRTAMGFHQAGQLAQAEQLYRQILQANPRHPEALHLLGLIAHQAGQHDAAADLISRAIAVQGSRAPFHSNLGEVYRALGRTAEARACYERALQLDPTLAAAHYNLGLILEAREPADAQRHYEQAIALQPSFAPAHNNLGNLFRAQSKPDEAIAAYQTALRHQSEYAEALNNLGVIYNDEKRFAEALEPLQRALRLNPRSADTHFNLGNTYFGLEDSAQAASAYQETLRIHPRHAMAHLQLGILLQEQHHFDQALEHYDRALEVKPDLAEAHYNRASALHFKKRCAEAGVGFQEAIRYRPDFIKAYVSLAQLLIEMSRPEEAILYARQGLEHAPEDGGLHGILATALFLKGLGEEAIAHYRKSVALLPENHRLHCNLLFALNFISAYDPSSLTAEHVEWARRHAEPLTAQAAPHENDRSPNRRLRVGYVSFSFCNHAVNYFIEPIITSHDHQDFEIFCYSTAYHPDDATARLQAAADHWRDVALKSDEQIAAMVREDKIDILVDLSGHMGQHRLLVFARKPAPIQVTYLGYQNTTGMSAIDYRLTDSRADPPGLTDALHTEKLVRLPRAFFCYQPFETPPITPLPALESGHLTFGSFNNFSKVTPQVLDAWFEILRRVPRSRLSVLAFRGGTVQQRLHELAQQRGIDPQCIELHDKRPRLEYLQLLQQADIGLDPFPFNGHTTTCDSIWMGVPVVMLQGQTYASRFGGSVLANLDLEHWIANSVDEYIERAVELASDLERLAQLRQQLRPRMADSALLDFRGFTRNLEQAYRRMWLDWIDQKDNRP